MAGDHFQAFARGRVGFFAEEGDDVVAIRREFDVFHAALGFDFVDEADGLAVGGGEGDDVLAHVGYVAGVGQYGFTYRVATKVYVNGTLHRGYSSTRILSPVLSRKVCSAGFWLNLPRLPAQTMAKRAACQVASS